MSLAAVTLVMKSDAPEHCGVAVHLGFCSLKSLLGGIMLRKPHALAALVSSRLLMKFFTAKHCMQTTMSRFMSLPTLQSFTVRMRRAQCTVRIALRLME